MKKILTAAALAAALAVAPSAAPAQNPPLVTPRNGLLEIRLIQTDLRAAILALAEYLDRPVIFGSVGSAHVTVETPSPITRAEVLPLLQTLLEAHGHEMVEQGGCWVVRQKGGQGPGGGFPQPGFPVAQPSPPRGEMGLFTIRLNHARASDVAATINALYGRSSALGEIGARTQTLDAQLRENRIPPVGAEPGVQVTGAPRGGSLSTEVAIVPEPNTNSLLIRGTQSDLELVRQAVAYIDIRPLQVLIEAVVVEVSRSASLNLGVTARTDTIGFRRTGTTVFGQNASVGLGDFVVQVMDIGGVDLDLTLRAAAGRGDVTIVNRPVVLTANNEAAEVLVGSQRPFVQLQRTLPTESGVRDQVVQYKDVGTRLHVLPTISADGYVMLEVSQEVNAATRETGFADAPVISTRSLQTRLLVRDGQTIVLGGLQGRERTVSRTGIPFLSRLPLIGWLFGATERVSNDTELFIFLTPRVIRLDADVDSVTSAVRRAAPRVDKAGRALKPLAAPPQDPKRESPPPAPPQATPAPPPAGAEPRR